MFGGKKGYPSVLYIKGAEDEGKYLLDALESKVPSLPAMYVMLMTMIILAIAVSSCSVVVHCTEVKAAHDAGTCAQLTG